jgi:hypothetical protein
MSSADIDTRLKEKMKLFESIDYEVQRELPSTRVSSVNSFIQNQIINYNNSERKQFNSSQPQINSKSISKEFSRNPIKKVPHINLKSQSNSTIQSLRNSVPNIQKESIFDRLYREKDTQKMKKQIIAEYESEQFFKNKFSPQISARANNIPYNIDRLMSPNTSERTQKQNQIVFDEIIKKFTFSPSINKKSRQIVSSLPSFEERMQSSITKTLNRSLSLTVSPLKHFMSSKTLRKSSEHVLRSSDKLYRRSMEGIKKKSSKILSKLIEKENEAKRFSFFPDLTLSKQSSKKLFKYEAKSICSSPVTVWRNNQNWVKRKDSKNKLRKDNNEKKENNFHTFTPKINKKVIQDDFKTINLEVPHMNKYVNKMIKFHKEKEKKIMTIEEKIYAKNFKVGERKLISPKTPEIQIKKNHRAENKNSKNIIRQREDLKVGEFFSNTIEIHQELREEEFIKNKSEMNSFQKRDLTSFIMPNNIANENFANAVKILESKS